MIEENTKLEDDLMAEMMDIGDPVEEVKNEEN
jgi:hypothetical protein